MHKRFSKMIYYNLKNGLMSSKENTLSKAISNCVTMFPCMEIATARLGDYYTIFSYEKNEYELSPYYVKDISMKHKTHDFSNYFTTEFTLVM